MEPIINQPKETDDIVDGGIPQSKETAIPSNNPCVATQPVASAATSKRTSDHGEGDTSNDTNSKRSRAEKDDSEGTIPSAPVTTEDGDILDLARTMELKDGDRIEVQWEVDINADNSDDNNEEEDEEEEDENKVVSIEEPATAEASTAGPHVHWWGATLLEHDGRTDDNVAIRTLLYDPYPEGGFPESSREDVIFMGPNVLLSYPSQDELTYRILTTDGTEVTYIISNDEDVEELVDTILSNALQNTSSTFQRLERSQQIKVAEKIATKKEKLIQLIKEHMMNGQMQSEHHATGNHWNRTVTAQDALNLLARAMQSE